MRVLYITVLVLFLVFTGCSAPQRAVVSERGPERQQIAREDKISLTEEMSFDERSEFYYQFEYDNNNLYITLATFNQNLQRKIVYFGFTVWIDRTGGSNKNQGFRFPVGARVPDDGDAGIISLSMMGYKAGPVESLMQVADEIDLIGIYGSSERRVRMRDSQIRVNAERINDLLFYEAVVPYDLIKFGFNPLAEKESVGIGLETGHYKAADNRSGQPRQPGPGSMMTPGGMHGQVPSRMPDRRVQESLDENMGDLARPTELWFELEFAQ